MSRDLPATEYGLDVPRALIVLVALALASCGGETPAATSPPVVEAPTPPTLVEPPPPAPPPDPGRAVAVARGGAFGCALRANGRVACWGQNSEGQLGQGHTDPVEGAREVVGLEDAFALAATASSACAVRGGGSVVCWGEARNGELGGRHEESSGGRLVTIAGVAGADAIWGGESRYCARAASGTMCWGSRTPALDVDVDRALYSTPPHRVALEGVERLSLGWRGFAFLRDGRVLRWEGVAGAPTELTGVRAAFAFSDGAYLALADGRVVRTRPDSEPLEVPGLRGARELGGSSHRVHGLDEDGRLLVVSRYVDVPPTVERAEGLLSIAPGEGDPLAVTREGGVRTWRQTDSTGRHLAAVEVVLPPTGVTAPAPQAPTGPLPRWCELEVRAVTPSEAPSLTALWEALVRDRHYDDPGPVDEAEARRWLCQAFRPGTAECETRGPILFQKSDYRGTAVAWSGPAGTLRWVDRLGLVSDGTEEASVVERAEVRSASPLEVMLEYSEQEIDCFGEEGDETCGLAEVRRRAFVVIEHGATVLIAELDLSASDMHRLGVSPDTLAAPRMRVEEGSVIVEACGGRASRPLPGAEAATPLPTSPAPGGVTVALPIEPPPTPAASSTAAPAGPSPTAAEVEAAASRCGAGFSRIGAGDLPGARVEIEAALEVLERGEGDRARRALGACLYNLGRVEEGEGDVPGARAAYRRSLEVRPHATVEERLRGLGG